MFTNRFTKKLKYNQKFTEYIYLPWFTEYLSILMKAFKNEWRSWEGKN